MGRGRKSSIRRLWQLCAVYAAVAMVIDVASGRVLPAEKVAPTS